MRFAHFVPITGTPLPEKGGRVDTRRAFAAPDRTTLPASGPSRIRTAFPLRTVPRAIFALAVLLTVCVAPAAHAQAQEPDFHKVLATIDTMSNFDSSDFTCTYTIVTEKPGKETSVTQARMFRRDSEKKFLILILQPDVQKGQGYLQAEDNLWFYDPESRKFAHSSLKENFQDSDAKNSDFKASSLANDYTIESHTTGTLGAYNVYILDLRANNDEVAYPHVKLWLRQDGFLVLKSEEYSLSDRLMRTAYYPSYVQVGSRYIPNRMLLVDALNAGEKTQVSLGDISVARVPDVVFTKSYLERVNR